MSNKDKLLNELKNTILNFYNDNYVSQDDDKYPANYFGSNEVFSQNEKIGLADELTPDQKYDINCIFNMKEKTFVQYLTELNDPTPIVLKTIDYTKGGTLTEEESLKLMVIDSLSFDFDELVLVKPEDLKKVGLELNEDGNIQINQKTLMDIKDNWKQIIQLLDDLKIDVFNIKKTDSITDLIIENINENIDSPPNKSNKPSKFLNFIDNPLIKSIISKEMGERLEKEQSNDVVKRRTPKP